MKNQYDAWALAPIKTCVQAYELLNGAHLGVSKNRYASPIQRLDTFDLLFALEATEQATKLASDPLRNHFIRPKVRHTADHEKRHMIALYVMKKGVEIFMKNPSFTTLNKGFFSTLKNKLMKNYKYWSDYKEILKGYAQDSVLSVLFPQGFDRKREKYMFIKKPALDFLNSVSYDALTFKIAKVYASSAGDYEGTQNLQNLLKKNFYLEYLTLLEFLPLATYDSKTDPYDFIIHLYSIDYRSCSLEELEENVRFYQPMKKIKIFILLIQMFHYYFYFNG